METKHTPGPWKVSTANPCAVNTFNVCIATTHGTDEANYSDFFPPTEQAKANARLIAAAPELLEALREWLAKEDASTPDGYEHNETPYKAKVRAAIAKATGNAI